MMLRAWIRAGKVVILANSLFDMDIKYSDVDVTGITGVSPRHLLWPRSGGYMIKLIGCASPNGQAHSSACWQPHSCGWNPELGCHLHRSLGDYYSYWPWAGSIQTASAILTDIISIYRTTHRRHILGHDDIP